MKRIFVIAGLSAVGKTTVMDKLTELCSDLEYIRSATTRAPRGDGRDSEYIYLTHSEFLSAVSNGEMLEYTEYGGNLYGTPSSEIERILISGKYPILILDINGVVSLKHSRYADEVCAVWLWDEPDVIEARLRERMALAPTREEGERIFNSRIAANRKDFERVKALGELFDLCIQNKNVISTAEKIKETVHR